LPENALSARFTTTAGPDLKQVSGTVYVGSQEGTSGEQRILWVKLFDKMYPTVYTLWYNPRIVPLLYTPLVVVEKMQAGADLMTPGLQRGPPFPKKATKGAIVAIASLEAPTVPMAVGTCEIDVSALGRVQGMKGQAISTFHWAGDELWSWSSTGASGGEPPDIIRGWDDEQDEDTTLAERTAAVNLDDQEGGIALDVDPTKRSEAEQGQGVEGEDAPSNRDFIDVVDDKELTTKGMSHLHRSCTWSNRIQRSMMHSRMHSCTAYGIIWNTTEISPTMGSTSLCPSRTLCLSSFNPSYPRIHRHEPPLCKSRNQVGRT
jgi:translation initiation factor 2D